MASVPSNGEFPAPTSDRFWVGKLLDHGRAPLEFHRHGHPSYYAELLTGVGKQMLWGAGLEAAFQKSRSQPQPGDHIGIRQNNVDPVSIVTRKRNEEGIVIATRQLDTPRPRWIVEKLQIFDMRAAAARTLRDTTVSRRDAVTNSRDLLAAYMILDTAQKLNDPRLVQPESRTKFVALLREALAQTLERGEPVDGLRSKSRASELTR